MDEIEIITTSDGSHTLRNTRLNETYHSIHGALQESRHVFILHGLEYFHISTKAEEISVLEVGFGTGLNAFLAAQYAETHKVSVRFTTLEAFPLADEVWTKLNYPDDNRVLFESLHRASWGEPVSVTQYFTIDKRKVSLQDFASQSPHNVIFFDAFAPSVQPEMWTYEMLRKVTESLSADGVFVTYSAKGQLKRDLRALGLRVEAVPGPAGKREMVRAVQRLPS